MAKIALLATIAVSGIATAAGVREIARNGMEMEISLEEAQEIEKAAQAAYDDMLNEEEGE